MTPERRNELVQRREQLKARGEREFLEAQRQDFLASLTEAGVIYSVADDAPLVDWITRRFKVDRWSSIDWRDVKQWRTISADIAGPPYELVRLADAEHFGDPEIAIVYADRALPSLRMQYSELAKRTDVILDSNWQTWAFDPASDWIIEFHHDLGWRWGRAA